MTEKISKINNPLTIIAIFATLAEISATVAISLIDKEFQHIFIWFIIIFPSTLVVLFFATLNLNNKVLYSPSDFREDKSFLDSQYGQQNDKQLENNFDENMLSQKLSEFEKKLIISIETKIKQTSTKSMNEKEMKALIEAQMKTLTISNDAIEFTIPPILKPAIVRWIAFPAFIPIIYAIITEKCNSIGDLNNVENKYNFVKQWEKGGMTNLFKYKILVGNNNNFSINEDISDALNKWIKLNEKKILSIIKSFQENNDDESEPARQYSQHFII